MMRESIPRTRAWLTNKTLLTQGIRAILNKGLTDQIQMLVSCLRVRLQRQLLILPTMIIKEIRKHIMLRLWVWREVSTKQVYKVSTCATNHSSLNKPKMTYNREWTWQLLMATRMGTITPFKAALDHMVHHSIPRPQWLGHIILTNIQLRQQELEWDLQRCP